MHGLSKGPTEAREDVVNAIPLSMTLRGGPPSPQKTEKGGGSPPPPFIRKLFYNGSW